MSKRGRTVAILLLAPLLLGGGVVGAALAGFLNIPGLTPRKGDAARLYGETAAALYGEGTGRDAVVGAGSWAQAARPPAAPPRRRSVPEPQPEVDPSRGAKRVAQLWNGLEVGRLKELAAEYGDVELAQVLSSMDPERAAELLGALEAARAARLSKEIGRQASLIQPER